MNYRSMLIVCLATLGLAVAGWGQADGKDVDNPADPSLPVGIGQTVMSSNGEAWVVGAIRRLTNDSDWDWKPSWSPDGRHIAFQSSRDHGNYEIYVMDIASYTGGEPTAVAETSWGRIKRHLQDRAGN